MLQPGGSRPGAARRGGAAGPRRGTLRCGASRCWRRLLPVFLPRPARCCAHTFALPSLKKRGQTPLPPGGGGGGESELRGARKPPRRGAPAATRGPSPARPTALPPLPPALRSRPPGLTKCRRAPLSPALLPGRGGGEARSAPAVSGALRSPRPRGRPVGRQRGAGAAALTRPGGRESGATAEGFRVPPFPASLPPPRGDTGGGRTFAGWWAGAAGRPETRGCGRSAAPGRAARV